jgi:hypothetical protein
MRARERLELLALYAAGLALVAFLASFVIGLSRPARHDSLAGAEPASMGEAEVPPPQRGRLEVLNGSGRAGLARQATERLRRSGFDVVYFGNAPARHDSSEVLDRAGSPVIARAAADELGITRVVSAPDSALLLDATVLLGRDWPRAAPAEVTAGRRGWWSRIKGWLGGE